MARKRSKHRCSECEHWKAGNSWRMIMGTVYAPGTCGNTGKPRMNVAYACRGNFKKDKTRGCFIRFQGIISDETDWMKQIESYKTCGNCQHWIPNGGKLGYGYCAANGMGYRKPNQSCKTRFEPIENDKEE